jgi:hypothetical protein
MKLKKAPKITEAFQHNDYFTYSNASNFAVN